MKRLATILAVATTFSMTAIPSVAQQPTAIVEDVRSSGAGIDAFEYLEQGKIINLGAADVVVLGYLQSCLRETITGGMITVGLTESVVDNGLVEREVVECDGGYTTLTTAEASKSGVAVFRAPDPSQVAKKPQKIYSGTPMFTFSDRVTQVDIRRVDKPRQTLALPVSGAALDMNKLGKALVPGGRYEARAGEHSIVFEIDRYAPSRGGPLIGRLVRL